MIQKIKVHQSYNLFPNENMRLHSGNPLKNASTTRTTQQVLQFKTEFEHNKN